MLGINTGADATNRLAVKSDAELLSHDDVTPGSGDARKVINKAGEGNTASVLFQTGFSGRAEIGLAGDDALHVKVSADGSGWTEALVIDPDTGHVGMGVATPAAPLTLDTQAYPGLSPGDACFVVTGNRGAERAEFRSTSLNPNAAFQGFGARGTPDTPEATHGDDRLFAVLASGHDGSDFVVPLPAQLDFKAEGDWSAGNHGARIQFMTTPNGATTSSRAERMRITGDGDVGIATTAPTCRLHVDGPVRTGSATVAGLPSASTCGAGAMMFVSNESGGAVMAFSDGTDWRRVTDRAVVS